MSENPYAAPTANPTPSYDSDLPAIPSLSNIQYPLQVSFKLLALAPQLQITDATGRSVIYIKQKLFKLKEKIEIFTDDSKSERIATIQANKVLDWSARYFFETENGETLGSVGRKGMASLWKATYETFTDHTDFPTHKISEENPMVKVFDSLLGEIPIVGMASSYLFNPKYGAVDNKSGQTVMRLTKKPAFFEGKFELEKLSDISQSEETNLLLSYVMLLLLEKNRG